MPSKPNILWDSPNYPTFSLDELEATLAFHLTPGFSRKKFQPLYDHYGSSLDSLKIAGISSLDKAKQELELAQKHDIAIIPITSPEYPKSIKVLADAPIVLYVKGKLPPQEAARVAIIGTRNATPWGIECTGHFAKHLAQAGGWIVSGLARGVDTEAHMASTGRTTAIIGSGLLHIYPKENEPLAKEIAIHGSIISEFSLNTSPTRYTFPKRNRLISAMADALLLTEAPIKSGAMITMNIGHTLKKPLFTVPGRAMNENYGGNHALIKSGKARLVDSPQELLQHLHLKLSNSPQNSINLPLISPSEQKILDILCLQEVSLDELSVKSCLPIAHLQVTLTKLVLKKLAVELPGKRYKGIG